MTAVFIYAAISAIFLALLVLRTFIMRRITLGLPKEFASISIKNKSLTVRDLPVARTFLQGSYGFIPFLDIKPGIILERSSFLIPVFSMFGIKRDVLLILIDKNNIIYDTRIFDNRFLSKLIFVWSFPDLVIELDMQALNLVNPTLIGEKVILKYS